MAAKKRRASTDTSLGNGTRTLPVRTKKKKVKSKECAVDMRGEIETISITKLKLWKENPRKNAKAVPRLAKLLEKHGQRTPIVAWSENNVVYKGNTTLKAAKKLGWKEIRVLFADFPSEAAAVAYGIADNKSSEWADWDSDVLASIMEAESLDAVDCGFDEPTVDVGTITATIEDDSMSSLRALQTLSGICPNVGLRDVAKYESGYLWATTLETFFGAAIEDLKEGALYDLSMLVRGVIPAKCRLTAKIKFPEIPFDEKKAFRNSLPLPDLSEFAKHACSRANKPAIYGVQFVNGLVYASDTITAAYSSNDDLEDVQVRTDILRAAGEALPKLRRFSSTKKLACAYSADKQFIALTTTIYNASFTDFSRILPKSRKFVELPRDLINAVAACLPFVTKSTSTRIVSGKLEMYDLDRKVCYVWKHSFQFNKRKKPIGINPHRLSAILSSGVDKIAIAENDRTESVLFSSSESEIRYLLMPVDVQEIVGVKTCIPMSIDNGRSESQTYTTELSSGLYRAKLVVKTNNRIDPATVAKLFIK